MRQLLVRNLEIHGLTPNICATKHKYSKKDRKNAKKGGGGIACTVVAWRRAFHKSISQRHYLQGENDRFPMQMHSKSL